MAGRLQQGGRYRPALLLLTWTDEALDALVSRLRIADHIAEFSRVVLLSLEDADTLDERFAHALAHLVPHDTDPRLAQVALHLRDVVARIEPAWDNLLHLARHVHARHPASAGLVADILANALTPLYRLAEAVDSALEDLPLSEMSEYEPLHLPRLIVPPGEKAAPEAVADATAAFLSSPEFAGVSQLALLCGPVRQAAAHARPLPAADVLSAVGTYIFGTLSHQCLRLEQWLAAPYAAAAAGTLADRIVASVEADLAAAANGIAQAGSEAQRAEQAQLAEAAAVPLPPSPPPKMPYRNKGTKRSIDETSASTPEGKAAKSARLLRILADAQATLNQIDRMDEQTGLLAM
jgi:hypothetical protein